jgi:hypothetical protein
VNHPSRIMGAVSRLGLGFLFVVASLAATPARAELSPELMSILNEIQGKLVTDFGADPKSRTDCQKEVINIARAALNNRNVASTGEKSGAILIGALEHSCKFYLGLTGLGALATTYSVAKCFYEYADDVNNDVGFIACLAGEAIGAGLGVAGEKLGVDDVRQAIADRVTDATIDKLKGEIASRRNAITNNEVDLSETTLGDGCKVQLNIQWTKARNPVRAQRSEGRAGTVIVTVGISECKCSLNAPYNQQLKNGSLIVTVPVNFVSNGSGQPSWQANFARMRTNLQATCCSGHVSRWGDPPRTDPRTPTDGPTATTPRPTGGTGVAVRPPPTLPVTPPPPVRPPPVTPPTPPVEQPKPLAQACPECAPLVDAVNRAIDDYNNLQGQKPALEDEIERHRKAAEDARRRIRTLEQQLNAHRGEGGSSFDPEAGVTITAVNNGDGTVTVTTIGPDGTVLERHTRDSQSAKDAQKQLPEARQREADAVAAEAAARNRLAQLSARIRQAAADIASANAALEKCIEECKRKTAGGVDIPPLHVIIGSPLNPVTPKKPVTAGPKGPGETTPTPPPPDPPARANCPACEGKAGELDTARAAVRETEARIEQARTEMHGLTGQFLGDGARKLTPQDNAKFGQLKDRLRALDGELRTRQDAAAAAERSLAECNGRCAPPTGTGIAVTPPGSGGQPVKRRDWPAIPVDPEAGYLPPLPKADCHACEAAFTAAAHISYRFRDAVENLEFQTSLLQAIRDMLDGVPNPTSNLDSMTADIVKRASAAELERATIGHLVIVTGAVASVREKREQYLAALRALEACNLRCKRGVEVGTVIGKIGTNPFNPVDPLGGTGGGTQQPPPTNSPGTLQLVSSIFAGGEGGAVLISVTRTGGTKGSVSVNYNTVAGTASAGADFSPRSGTLTWSDGDSTPKSFSVPLVDDTAPEPTETFSVTLEGVTGGATLGSPATATVSISDNDSPTPPQPAGALQFSASNYTIAENGGAVTITVTRTGGTAGEVTVQYLTGPSSAVAGSDYTATSGVLSWGAGDAGAKSFTIPVIDDTTTENTETFFVTLNNPTGGATLGAPATSTVTITDNDVATGPCGSAGNAWQGNAGTYVCSGSCNPTPSPQTLSVNGDVVTISPHHAGGAATFQGCGNTLTSQSSTLTYFGQSNHTNTITRGGNTLFSVGVQSAGGGSCSFSCSR